MVFAQSPARLALLKVCVCISGECIASAMKTNAGMDITTRQATTSKQLDMFFKENLFFISVDILFFLRLLLTT
jgi:hypothetical protein